MKKTGNERKKQQITMKRHQRTNTQKEITNNKKEERKTENKDDRGTPKYFEQPSLPYFIKMV